MINKEKKTRIQVKLQKCVHLYWRLPCNTKILLSISMWIVKNDYTKCICKAQMHNFRLRRKETPIGLKWVAFRMEQLMRHLMKLDDKNSMCPYRHMCILTWNDSFQKRSNLFCKFTIFHKFSHRRQNSSYSATIHTVTYSLSSALHKMIPNTNNMWQKPLKRN